MDEFRQIQKDIAALLRGRRVELDLTLKQVAERAEVSVGYVSNLELARGNPTLSTMERVFRALDLRLYDYLRLENA